MKAYPGNSVPTNKVSTKICVSKVKGVLEVAFWSVTCNTSACATSTHESKGVPGIVTSTTSAAATV